MIDRDVLPLGLLFLKNREKGVDKRAVVWYSNKAVGGNESSAEKRKKKSLDIG